MRKTSKTDSLEINLTPLIDVIFMLMIFFMLSSVFVQKQILSIDLPTSLNSSPQSELETIEVEIDSNGKYIIDGIRIARKDLSFELLKKDPKLGIVISADKNTRHKDVVFVMDLISQFNFAAIQIATLPVSE